jgi:hypothetical protein
LSKKLQHRAITLLTVLLVCCLSVNAQVLGQIKLTSPEIDWQNTYNGPNVKWVGQSTDGTVTFFTPGAKDTMRNFIQYAYIERVGSTGGVVSQKQIDVPFPEVVITTNDGGYAYTTRNEEPYYSFTGQITIHKLSADFAQTWQKTLPNSYDGGVMFIQTSDAGYALATQTTARGSDGQLVIIKTNSQAELQWIKNITSINETYSIHSFIQTSDGGYAFSGAYSDPSGINGSDFFMAKTDFIGNLQWIKTFGGINDDSTNSIIQTSDGFVIVGNTASFGAGSTDALLVKTDVQGNLLWAHTYGGVGPKMVISGQTYRWGGNAPDVVYTFADPGSSDDYAYCLVKTKDDGLAFAGTTQNFIWLVKTDANGFEEWAQAYGDFKSAIVYADKIRWGLGSFIQTQDGSFVLAGQAVGQSYWDQSAYIIKTKPDTPSPTTSQPTCISSTALPTIVINPDGSVSPSTAPITNDGNRYQVTQDLHGSLIIRADNIVLDGQGHYLNGNGTVGDLFVLLTQTGVDTSNAKNVTINNLKINNFKVGLLLDNSDSVSASQNTFSQNNQAVTGTGTINTRIIKNNFINDVTGHQQALNLAYALNSVISDNLLAQGSITVANSSGVILSGNVFPGIAVGTARFGGGISLNLCNNALVCENLFLCSGTATEIISSREVTVAANNYTNCDTAITAYGVGGTIIYKNNFADDAQIWSLQTTRPWSDVPPIYISEVWDNGQTGNYYSNYTNQNHNAKMVTTSSTWDTPYVLDENNTDRHPLTSPMNAEQMQDLSYSLISAHSQSSSLSFAGNVGDSNQILVVFSTVILTAVFISVFWLVRVKKRKSDFV